MGRVFIDLSESPWGRSELGATIKDNDGLTGTNSAIVMGQVELVLSVPQMTSLYDLLDGWMNTVPLRELGDVEIRLMKALRETVEDLKGLRGMNASPEATAQALRQNIRMHGLRFKLADGAHA